MLVDRCVNTPDCTGPCPIFSPGSVQQQIVRSHHLRASSVVKAVVQHCVCHVVHQVSDKDLGVGKHHAQCTRDLDRTMNAGCGLG